MCILCTSTNCVIDGDVNCCEKVTQIENVTISGTLFVNNCNLVYLKDVKANRVDITHCYNLKTIENICAQEIYFYKLENLETADKLYAKNVTVMYCYALKLTNRVSEEFYCDYYHY